MPGGSFRFYGLLFLLLWQARKGNTMDTEFATSGSLCRRLIRPGKWTNPSPSVTRNCLLDTYFFAGV